MIIMDDQDAIKTETGPLEDLDGLTDYVNKDGIRLFRKYWLPGQQSSELNPRGLVFIAHGAGEHCLRYTHLAKFLSQKDYLLFSHDHVGHGQSEGERVYINDVDSYVTDVLQHTDMMTRRFPGLPLFIIGHSMGGTIAMRAAMLRQDYFKGVILIAPAIIPNPNTVTPIKIMSVKLLSTLCPRANIDKIDTKTLCRDKTVVKEIDADPLYYHGSLKARWARAMLRMLRLLERRLAEFTAPFLVLHGTKDALTYYEGSQRLYDMAKSADKTFKKYPNAFHQLHFEPDGVALSVQDEICNWIEERI